MGSADARANLTDAIQSQDTFNLESANGASDVAFAKVDAGTVTKDTQTGVTSTSYKVRIDFTDFSHLEGDKDAKAAFTVGIAALHEFDHKLYGDLLDTPNGPNDPGPVENTYVNPIRAQLGLAQRATYIARPGTGVSRDFNPGYVQVRFTLNGKDKILRWKDSVVGGTRN